jgi:hypothetical protein
MSALLWALLCAVPPKQRPTVQLLMDRGASAHAGTTGCTALHALTLSEDCDATLLSEFATLLCAARPGVEVVTVRFAPTSTTWKIIFKLFALLWRLGSRTSTVEDFAHALGSTPLHAAARRGDYHAITALLGAGADPTIPNRLGRDAETTARIYDAQFSGIAKLLLAASKDRCGSHSRAPSAKVQPETHSIDVARNLLNPAGSRR